MAQLYLISYDLVTPGKNYDALWTALSEKGAVRILYSAWMLRMANSSPKATGDHFVQFMDNNDRIFVTEVPSNYAYRTLLAAPLAA